MIGEVSATKFARQKITWWNLALTVEFQGFEDCIPDVGPIATNLLTLKREGDI